MEHEWSFGWCHGVAGGGSAQTQNPEPASLSSCYISLESGNLGSSWRVGFSGLKIGLVILESESGSVGYSLGCLHL